MAFILVNTIYYPRTLKSNIKELPFKQKGATTTKRPPPFFHSDTSPVFGHVLIYYFDKSHVLVGTVELIWLLLLNILNFNFAPGLNKFMLGWQDSGEAM